MSEEVTWSLFFLINNYAICYQKYQTEIKPRTLQREEFFDVYVILCAV
jgi:hypothetical protein